LQTARVTGKSRLPVPPASTIPFTRGPGTNSASGRRGQVPWAKSTAWLARQRPGRIASAGSQWRDRGIADGRAPQAGGQVDVRGGRLEHLIRVPGSRQESGRRLSPGSARGRRPCRIRDLRANSTMAAKHPPTRHRGRTCPTARRAPRGSPRPVRVERHVLLHKVQFGQAPRRRIFSACQFSLNQPRSSP